MPSPHTSIQSQVERAAAQNPRGLAQAASHLQAALAARDCFSYSARLPGSRGAVGQDLAAATKAHMDTPALAALAFGAVPRHLEHQSGSSAKKRNAEADQREGVHAVVSVPHSIADCETGQTVNAAALVGNMGLGDGSGNEGVLDPLLGWDDGSMGASGLDEKGNVWDEDSGLTEDLQGCSDWVRSRALTSAAMFPPQKRARQEVWTRAIQGNRVVGWSSECIGCSGSYLPPLPHLFLYHSSGHKFLITFSLL